LKNIPEDKLRHLLIDKGFTDIQAAKELGVSKETIRRRRSILDIKPKPKCPSGFYDITPEEDKILRDLYSQGKNDYEVAAAVHRGRSTLRIWRKDNGVTSQTRKKGLSEVECKKAEKLLKEGKTLTEVGEVLGVNRTSVSKLMRRFGKNYNEYRPKHPDWVDSYELTGIQKLVVIGDLFGDGGLFKTSQRCSSYYTAHAVGQEFFIRWKASILGRLVSSVKNNKDNSSVTLNTWTSPYFGELYKIFYIDGEKQLRKQCISMLTPLSLAVWFMGDGSLNKKTPLFHLGLKVDGDLLAQELKSMFDIKFECRTYRKEKNLRVIDVDVFYKKISKYLLKDFSYKVPLKYQGEVGSYWAAPDFTNVTPQIYSTLESSEKKKIIDKLFKYYKKRGFPYPHYNKRTLRQDCLSLSNLYVDKIDISKKYLYGQRTCNHFMKHRYDAKRFDSDPMSVWLGDDNNFKKFMENRLRYASGRITDSVIRTGMSLRGIPANFSPVIAKHIYNKYCSKESSVLDFSSGYGGRLLGWMSLSLSGSYYGVEPCAKSFNGLERMSEYCSEFFGLDKNNIKLYNAPFEDLSFGANQFDLVFSSPPYYGLEIYSDEQTQSINRYPDYKMWLEMFWTVLAQNCYKYLKPGGRFIYSVGDYKGYTIVNDTLDILGKIGFKDSGKILSMGYHNVYANKKKLETIFILNK